MKEHIECGDIVQVNFNQAKYTLSNRAKVLVKPDSNHDYWRLLDLDSGDIHWVSEGCTITRKQSDNKC